MMPLDTRRGKAMGKISKAYFVLAVDLLGSIGSLRAQAPLHDPNLPTASPEALQQLSDSRVRQKIMENSQAHYVGRCVCQYMTQDSQRRSCKGRHEVIKTKPVPICYPRQVAHEMVSEWRRQHKWNAGETNQWRN
jgi:hypothetical protein